MNEAKMNKFINLYTTFFLNKRDDIETWAQINEILLMTFYESFGLCKLKDMKIDVKDTTHIQLILKRG